MTLKIKYSIVLALFALSVISSEVLLHYLISPKYSGLFLMSGCLFSVFVVAKDEVIQVSPITQKRVRIFLIVACLIWLGLILGIFDPLFESHT